jgi:hypothetical protein
VIRVFATSPVRLKLFLSWTTRSIWSSCRCRSITSPIRVARRVNAGELRTGVRERIPAYPYVEFFPASRPIMDDVLPTVAFIREVFESAGFRAASADIVTQQIAPDLAVYAEKLAAGADSVLAQLNENDFKAGIAALRAHAARAGDKPVREPIDVLVFR